MAWVVNKDGSRAWVPTAAEKQAQAATSKILGSNSTVSAGTYANNSLPKAVAPSVSAQPFGTSTNTSSTSPSDTTATTSSFLGGLANSLASGYNNLVFKAPTAYAYKDNEGVGQSLDLTGIDPKYMNADVVNAINNPYQSATGTFGPTDGYGTIGGQQGLAGTLSGLWDTIGGAKGFADLAGGLGALGSLYTGYKQNKMAEQEHNARMGELARQRQRDADWQRDIKASGLGTYSAGMGGN